jgi:hypothetical protein
MDIGSGSTYVYGYCDATYKEKMNEDETVTFVKNSKLDLDVSVAESAANLVPCISCSVVSCYESRWFIGWMCVCV